jgi:hypothetical protein
MKRKEKSGHKKHIRKSLKEAASASGQKSLLTFFETVNLSVLKEMPLPGGKEEKYLEEIEVCSVVTDERCGGSHRTNAIKK